MNKEIIKRIETEYGNAFYLLDSKQFRLNYQELRDTFRLFYPKVNIAYSYKTNYTPKLCKIVNDLGGYAEVVSDMELDIALKVGVEPARIIWNGPVKDKVRLKEFLLSGGTLNIDSYEEFEVVRGIVLGYPEKIFNLGIRCNFEVGDGVISRFGFDIESRVFKDIILFLSNTPNVIFKNYQCHFAKRQLEYWPSRVQGMLDIIQKYGIIPERIDIGGGIFGKMDDFLKSQFSGIIPDYYAYAEASACLFADFFKNKSFHPELVIEPGSALVGDCMKFVCSVESIKNVRGKWYATVMGSQKNISMGGVQPPIEIVPMGNPQKFYKNLDFVGFTCIEGDVLYRDYDGMLANGDMLVISNCGSYSLVMKPPFILPNFPVLDVSEDRIEVIKRAETFEDLFRTFEFL